MPVVLLVAACGCSRQSSTSPAEKMLAVIDSLLTVRPDSALRLVEMFPDSLLRTSRDTALFRLMRAEARYKNFIDDTSEVEISAAARHFVESGDLRNAMRSLFAQGCILRNAGESGEAISTFLEAENMADTTDHFYLGKIYAAMRETYKDAGDVPQEQEFARRSYEHYQRTDSVPFIQDATLWYGLSLCRSGLSQEGIPMITRICNEAKELNDEEMLATSLMYLASAYLWADDWLNGKLYYDILLKYRSFEELPEGHLNSYLSCMLAIDAKNDSIQIAIDYIKSHQGETEVPFEYYVHQGDYKNAFKNLKHEYDIQDKWYVAKIRNEANSAARIFNDMKFKEQNIKLEYERDRNFLQNSVICLMVLIFLLVIYVLYIRYSQKKNSFLQILKKSRGDLSDMREQLDCIRKENDKIKITDQLLRKSEKYISSVFLRIGAISSLYYNSSEKEKNESKVLKNIRKELDMLKEDRDLVENMEWLINFIHNNLLSDVCSSVTLNKNQRKFVMLRCVDFSKESVCGIEDISMQAYYDRSRRVIAAISGSSSNRKDELISLITRK